MDGATVRAERAVDDAELPEGLSRREYDILAFERQWWKYAGAKEEAIAQLSSAAKVSIAGVFILLDRQEKDKEGNNAIAAFEAKHKTKVHAIATADEVFEHLSKNKAGGALHVTPEMHAQYKSYRKKYGI